MQRGFIKLGKMVYKKIVIATDNFLPRWDGITRFLTEVVPKLVHDFKVTLLAPMFDNSAVGFSYATTVRFPVLNFQVGDFPPVKPPISKIRKYIKEADIVWIQTIGPIGALAAIYAKRYNKHLVGYAHSIEWELVPNSIKNRFLKPIMKIVIKYFARYIYNKCDILMMPSVDIGRIFEENKIIAPKAIVKLGTNVNKFIPPNMKAAAKLKLGIKPHKKVIGFVGRIGREKDVPTLYRAFTQLKRQMSDVVLLVVGSGVKDVENLLGKRKDIIMVGTKDDVVPYLQAMDIYVLPSLTETTSLSTIEAMSCGCAVLATKVGRIPEYITNNYNGVFFPKGNSYVLRKKLEKLLNDEELMETLGKNARKSVIEKFSWQATIDDIEKVFDGFVPDES